ncbi:hypothetical protein ACFVT5_10175 [Streptomyces sp. NPDC058001]|uniref:hypothetical protein n=1 Tax=Streptomyces sp. NPDC058001 TaxID=3346300 RepID=UPI0036E6C200
MSISFTHIRLRGPYLWTAHRSRRKDYEPHSLIDILTNGNTRPDGKTGFASNAQY